MCDGMEQTDELLALASIYDESILTSQRNTHHLLTGILKAFVQPPQPFCVKLVDTDIEHKVQHLPPVILMFTLPADYPSHHPPSYSISCPWLTDDQITLAHLLDTLWCRGDVACWQISQVRESLDMLWCRGDVVLFSWMNFLQNDIIDTLSITCPLSVSPRSLTAILDHDAQLYKKEFDTALHTCEVCFTDKPGSKCLLLHACHHVFCQECLHDYCKVHIEEGSVGNLKCMSADCTAQLQPAQVKELVSDELYDRYDRLLLQQTLDTMSDVVYCPRKACQCPTLVDEAMGSCPLCQYVFCIYCKLAYHGVSPCRLSDVNVKQLREEYLESEGDRKKLIERRYGRKNIQKLVEDSYSEEWICENSKQCPLCSAYIQKIDGCNKMRCTKCGSCFCWLCMSLITTPNPYTHFNAVNSACFNKLFFENIDDELLL